MKPVHICSMRLREVEIMRSDYKVPAWVKKNVINELYHYWDNVKMLEELKEEIIEASPAPPDGLPRGNLRGSPTESKAMKLNSRAILVTANKIMQIENVIKMLNEEEKKVFEVIFKERLSQIQAYMQKGISKEIYYNVRSKAILFGVFEMGYIIN